MSETHDIQLLKLLLLVKYLSVSELRWNWTFVVWAGQTFKTLCFEHFDLWWVHWLPVFETLSTFCVFLSSQMFSLQKWNVRLSVYFWPSLRCFYRTIITEVSVQFWTNPGGTWPGGEFTDTPRSSVGLSAQLFNLHNMETEPKVKEADAERVAFCWASS